jgi:peptidoglycan/LPS O-acetylase OafA/YrhL
VSAAAPLPLSEPRAAVENRLLALTGLRIFAALAVCASHIGAPHGSPRWLALGFQSGYFGVTLFFVLSGFVLAINYADQLARLRPRRLWSYAVARIARVYPLYFAVLAYLAIKGHVETGHVSRAWPWHVASLQAWLPDVLDAFTYGPSWSISVEAFLYLAFPFLIVALRPLAGVRGLLAAVLVTMAVLLVLAWWFEHSGRGALPVTDPGSAHRWLYRTPLTRLGDFLLGILAARLYAALRGRPRAGRAGAALALAGVAAILFFTTQSWMFYSSYSWDVAYAVPSTCLILGLALSPRAPLSRLLSLPAIVFLGEASYAFYLIHASAISSLGPGIWATRLSPGTFALELCVVGLVIALSIGLHIGLERPARRFLRSFLDRRRPARVRPLGHYG